MKSAFFFTIFTILSAASLSAAVGEVTVSVESSTDLSSWAPAATGEVDVSTPLYFRAKVVPVDGGSPTYSEVILATTSHPEGLGEIFLESSSDLTNWSVDSTGVVDVSGSKKFFRVREATAFVEVLVDATGQSFDNFTIGKYEVTKEEWDEVYDWAVQNGYTFTNAGDGCDLDHPVQSVSWYDVVKWCNAKSEKEGFTPVYYTDSGLGTVYRTGEIDLTTSEIDTSADGFRLPTEVEWDYAAYAENSPSGYIFSGSNTPSVVAIYFDNSNGAACSYNPNNQGTFPVGTKAPNEIGTFDMTGNVLEWLFDDLGGNRSLKGGGYTDVYLVGPPLTFDNLTIANSQQDTTPVTIRRDFGFRLVKQIPPAPAVALSIEESASGKKNLSRSKNKSFK